MSELYRGGFILADGRKVYISQRGLLEQQSAAVWQKVGWPTATADLISQWAYTLDLQLFGRYEFFLAHDMLCSRCARFFTEPASAPVDPRAWLIGGLPAAELPIAGQVSSSAAPGSGRTYRIGPVANGHILH